MANTAPRMWECVETDHTGASACGVVGPANAKRINGVWFPIEENYIPKVMLEKKHYEERDGKMTFQYRKLKKAMRRVRSFRTALDVGAHIGTWSMWLAKDFEYVHAFEPNESAYRLFPWNVQGNYTLHKVAVGDKPGTIGLDKSNKSSALVHAKGKGDIPVITIDSLDLQDVDFIKADVEGFEEMVMRGAEQTILRCRPVIVVEQKANEVNQGFMRDGALHFLTSLGMRSVENLAGDHVMMFR